MCAISKQHAWAWPNKQENYSRNSPTVKNQKSFGRWAKYLPDRPQENTISSWRKMTASTKPTPLILKADPLHSGIRLLVPLILVAAAAASFLLLRWLLRLVYPPHWPDYLGVLACSGGLGAGLALTALTETLLRRWWPSGRQIVVDEHSIQLRANGRLTHLDRAKPMTSTYWYFRLKGYPRAGAERRPPESHLCLACRLQQDEATIILYAFMPPKLSATWTADKRFHELRPADLYRTTPGRRLFTPPTRPKLSAELIRSQDGPYWLAERARWQDGLELTSDDFSQLMPILDFGF